MPTTYIKIITTIVEKEGITNLLGRGLKTKIISNGIQSIIFTIIWNMNLKLSHIKNNYQ